MGIDSGGKDLDPVPFQVPCPCLCHLASARIATAKIKNFHCQHPPSRHGAAGGIALRGPSSMRTVLNYTTTI
jgi:hypothetical protein